MNVIGNYPLIDDAKPDPYTCLERGTYPVYYDAIHFVQFAISKSSIFWVGFDENWPNMNNIYTYVSDKDPRGRDPPTKAVQHLKTNPQSNSVHQISYKASLHSPKYFG